MINGNLTVDNNPQLSVAGIPIDDASKGGQGTSRAWGLAGQMLLYETGEGQIESEITNSALRVYEKLRFQLSSYVGSTGFYALMIRAKALATMEYPWLSALQINQDGALVGLVEAAQQQNGTQIVEGITSLIGNLLQIMESFIGGELSLRLLRGIWPNLSEDALASATGEESAHG